jgi:hypothetical protein
MEIITQKEINNYAINDSFMIKCSIKQSKDSKESKTVTLRVRMHNAPLLGVVSKALRPTVISWQNGPGRGKYDLWKTGSVIDIDFQTPGKSFKTYDELLAEYIAVFKRSGKLTDKQCEEYAKLALENGNDK